MSTTTFQLHMQAEVTVTLDEGASGFISGEGKDPVQVYHVKSGHEVLGRIYHVGAWFRAMPFSSAGVTEDFETLDQAARHLTWQAIANRLPSVYFTDCEEV